MPAGSRNGGRPLMAVDTYDTSLSNPFDDSTTSPAVKPFSPSSVSSNVLPRALPSSFHLFMGPFRNTYHLAEHPDHPVYAVTTHSGWSGNPDVVLHTGTSKTDTPLAAAEIAHSIPAVLTVQLPAGTASGANTPVSTSSTQHGVTIEPLVVSGGMSKRYRFGIEVDGIREEFEWRHSSGSVIKDNGSARQGWKLMRMETGVPGGRGGEPRTGPYMSSDGKEVVGVWTNVQGGGSASKAWRFAFLGTGASGALGERWALMAVMTALLMWQQERKARTSGAEEAGLD